MAQILFALGLVLFVEGLAYALAPHLLERMLEMLRALPIPSRRQVGLVAMALGLMLVLASDLIPF
ncbi:DUF2065 domain-containing protein [Poseidonocella sedimentorum]|uniref:DUF2065 domain-containing protein n=1 Tax=Poseidonocella sedimentorum TaxID=871652 RepID=UPI000B81E232|nr:DUF2065 domain-containing protein [Poseidonocella sedimentorum]